MERQWPVEALDFGGAVRGALDRAGGIELARRCEADPELRTTALRPVIDALGLLELSVDEDPAAAAAAALAVHAAGQVVCPWPLLQQLAVPTDLRGDIDALYLQDRGVTRAEHLDLTRSPAALDVTTAEVVRLRTGGRLAPTPLDPFGTPTTVTEQSEAEHPTALSAALVLSGFWIAGALGTARDLAAEHARERRQFGRRISEFGGIQWHLSDIAVAHDGLWELSCFSLARMIDRRCSRADALALHYAALDAARTVLTAAHQILAAMGLCEEHDLTVIDRHLQPMLRRPCGATRTLSLLADEVGRSGFHGLYPVPAPSLTYERAAAQT